MTGNITWTYMPEITGIEAFGEDVDTRLMVFLREKDIAPFGLEQPKRGHFKGYFKKEDLPIVFKWLGDQGAQFTSGARV